MSPVNGVDTLGLSSYRYGGNNYTDRYNPNDPSCEKSVLVGAMILWKPCIPGEDCDEDDPQPNPSPGAEPPPYNWPGFPGHPGSDGGRENSYPKYQPKNYPLSDAIGLVGEVGSGMVERLGCIGATLLLGDYGTGLFSDITLKKFAENQGYSYAADAAQIGRRFLKIASAYDALDCL